MAEVYEKGGRVVAPPSTADSPGYSSQEPFGSYSGTDVQVYIRKTMPRNAAKIAVSKLNKRRAAILKDMATAAPLIDNNDPFGRDRSNKLRDWEEHVKYILQPQIDALDKQIADLQKAKLVLFKVSNIETLSISTHREKYPVRSFAATYARGFTRGPRTVAGTLAFTIFDQGALAHLITQDNLILDAGQHTDGQSTTYDFRLLLPDQIMPFDILIVYANEYGNISSQALFDVEIVNEGQNQSIHDLVISNTMNYVARGISPMRLDKRTYRTLSDMHAGVVRDDQLTDTLTNLLGKDIPLSLETLMAAHEGAPRRADGDLF